MVQLFDQCMREVDGHPLTDEQNIAVDLAMTGKNLKIEARAGAGKTSTLIVIGEELRNPGLYIAFNKSIADEARGKFPPNVTCRTAHSLAYGPMINGHFGQDMKKRLNQRLVPKVIVNHMGIDGQGEEFGVTNNMLARLALSTINRFCHSKDEDIQREHAPWNEMKMLFAHMVIEKGNKDTEATRDASIEQLRDRLIIPIAVELWGNMVDPHGTIPITHDTYLKLWALGHPRLNYSYIMVDEAQDLNGVLLGLLERQECQIIYVGDRFQQIYSWRGAQNAMAKVNTDNTCEITQSFRFGEPIAHMGRRVLREQLGVDVAIRGFDKIQSSITKDLITFPDAILCRTNKAAFVNMIRLVNLGKRVAFAGGVGDLLALIYGAQDIMKGSPTECLDLAAFDNWSEVTKYSQTPEGGDLKVMVDLVDKYGTNYLIKLLRDIQYVPEREADIVISTAHKSKGREWNRVVLADDFLSPFLNSAAWHDEDANLLYVAATRAKNVLGISNSRAAKQALCPADFDDTDANIPADYDIFKTLEN